MQFLRFLIKIVSEVCSDESGSNTSSFQGPGQGSILLSQLFEKYMNEDV